MVNPFRYVFSPGYRAQYRGQRVQRELRLLREEQQTGSALRTAISPTYELERTERAAYRTRLTAALGATPAPDFDAQLDLIGDYANDILNLHNTLYASRRATLRSFRP